MSFNIDRLRHCDVSANDVRVKSPREHALRSKWSLRGSLGVGGQGRSVAFKLNQIIGSFCFAVRLSQAEELLARGVLVYLDSYISSDRCLLGVRVPLLGYM
jgi:hypothetical protein